MNIIWNQINEDEKGVSDKGNNVDYRLYAEIVWIIVGILLVMNLCCIGLYGKLKYWRVVHYNKIFETEVETETEDEIYKL